MKKDEFHELFKDLVDVLKVSAIDLADNLKVMPNTVTRWYNGDSAPATMARATIIKKLYAEQQKQEKIDFVKKVIRDSISISVSEPNYFDSAYRIEVKLDNEVIASDVFYVENENED